MSLLAATAAVARKDIRIEVRGRYGLSSEQVRFFDQFAAAPHGFDTQALAVIESGLSRGVAERDLRRAARLLQGYELLYWDTLLGELQR